MSTLYLIHRKLDGKSHYLMQDLTTRGLGMLWAPAAVKDETRLVRLPREEAEKLIKSVGGNTLLDISGGT